jgi:hypothetical protein
MMRPDRDELARRAAAADEKLRAISRRADQVRELVFERLSAGLPIVRLDLYGTAPTNFHAEAYFATAREAVRLNTSDIRSQIETAILSVLGEVDPSATNPEVRIEIDSVERLERRDEGFFNKFR